MAYNPRVSIVDYLASQKKDHSFSSRQKLASQYGISNYRGTSAQNTQLLNYLKNPAPKPAPVATKPTIKPAPVTTQPVKPMLTADNWQQHMRNNGTTYDWSNPYTGALNGNNTRVYYNGKIIDTANASVINAALQGGARIMGSNYANLGDQTYLLKDLQLAALSGNAEAKKFMDSLKIQGMTDKKALWEGVTNDQLNASQGLRAAYMKDNPLADYTKNYDQRHYDIYNDWIQNDAPMTDAQLKWYKNMIDKWNYDDMTDPFVQQQKQLAKDKEGALSAQDVALNQGLGAQDANNFQLMQQVQEQMAQRGMTGSGIAADAYMRAQMGMNQNYQQAFADAALAKSDLNTQYNDAIANSKLAQQGYQDQKAAQEAAQKIAQQEVDIELQKMQTEQDRFLTTSTGYIYLNGQMLKNGGKPITTLEYQKLSETQRHNMAQEALTGQKQQYDFQLGMDSNAIKREQIAADLQTTMAKMKLDYAKLDYNYAKLEANNKIQQDKIKIAADNAQTSATKGQITALGKQLSSVTSQITAYQKNGKKPPKSLVDQYNSLQNQISSLVGGSGF